MKELTTQIENRLQFLITISIFFPVLLYSFFQTFGESEKDSNAILLKAASLVFVYLIDYILFLIVKKDIGDKRMRWLNILVIVGIASFILPISLTAYLGPTLSQLETYLVVISLSVQSGMTLVILFF